MVEDIIMRKLAVFILVVMATVSYAEGQEGSFVPVEVQPQSVAGSYTGPSESYGLVLEVASDGTLRGNYVEMGGVAVLHGISLRGSEFTARASFDDGSLRTISGSFLRRDGSSAFGLQLHAVPVEGVGLVDTFFQKL